MHGAGGPILNDHSMLIRISGSRCNGPPLAGRRRGRWAQRERAPGGWPSAWTASGSSGSRQSWRSVRQSRWARCAPGRRLPPALAAHPSCTCTDNSSLGAGRGQAEPRRSGNLMCSLQHGSTLRTDLVTAQAAAWRTTRPDRGCRVERRAVAPEAHKQASEEPQGRVRTSGTGCRCAAGSRAKPGRPTPPGC